MSRIKMWVDAQGFTIAELVVAALFAVIVIATLYRFYRQQLLTLHSQEMRTATLADARGALDIMIRELRNAGSFPVATDATCVKDGSGKPLRVVAASADSIQIQTDTQSVAGGDPDGKCTATGENVTYAFLPTSTAACPGGRIARNEVCLVANVGIPSGSFLTYYDAAGTVLSPPIADVGAIRRVKITFAVEVKNPHPGVGGTLASTLSSSAEFRN